MPCDDARQRLIERHLGVVDAIAARFTGRGESREDLVQVGALALVRAVDRLDPARPATERAYLARCVEGEIRRHLRDRSGQLRVPRRALEVHHRVWRARTQLRATLGREPTSDELASAADVRPADIVHGTAAATALRPLPLDDEHVVVDVTRTEDAMLTRALVDRALGVLDTRERRLVLLRYVVDLSQAEIATTLGVSQPHVSRLLRGATEKMRRQLEPPVPLSRSGRSATLDRDGKAIERSA